MFNDVQFSFFGFFPRVQIDPTTNQPTGVVDEGWCSRETCHRCEKQMLLWLSIHYCPYCNHYADYWHHGNEEIAEKFQSSDPAEVEAEYCRLLVSKQLKQLGLTLHTDYELEVRPDGAFGTKIRSLSDEARRQL